MRIKILRVVIWLNGLVAVSLVLSLMMVWITAPTQYGPYIIRAVEQFFILCVVLFTILGIGMLIMKILIRRDRDNEDDYRELTSRERISGGRSYTEDST